jgi:hypothetical protein
MSERIERVLRNMEKLSAGGATPEETTTYLRSEGFDPKSFANSVDKYNKSKGLVSEFGPVKSALQGLSFGFSDEAEAGIKALLGKGSYEQNLASLQLAKEQFEQESPGLAMASEFAGAIPTALVGGAGAYRAAQMLSQRAPGIAQAVSPRVTGIGGAAVGGGVASGVTGAGTAEPGQRMAGAASAAPIGAALGPAVRVAPQAVSALPGVRQGLDIGREVLSKIPGVDITTDFARRADVKLLQALQQDGFSPDQIAARIQSIKQSGYKPETIMELGGTATRTLADTIAGYPGARGFAAELAESRSAGQVERVMTDFRQALRVNADAFELAEDIIKKRDAAAAPLYRQAYQEGGVISDDRFMGFMKIPQFKDAYARAKRIAALDGIDLPEKATDIEKVGGFDLMTLDYIKRGLDDVLFTGKQPGSGIGKTELGKLKQKRNEFVAIIDEAGPASYRQARQAFAGPTEVADAIDMGRKFANIDPRQLAKDFEKLSEAEKDGFRVGVFDAIKSEAEKGVEGRNIIPKIWNSIKRKDQVRALIGDDAFQELSDKLRRENLIKESDVSIMSGSPTQRRQLAQREFEAEEGIVPLMADRGMVRGGLDYLLRSATGPGQPTAQALAPTIFSTDVARQLETMNRLRGLDELLRQEAARSAGTIGTGAGISAGLLGD